MTNFHFKVSEQSKVGTNTNDTTKSSPRAN